MLVPGSVNQYQAPGEAQTKWVKGRDSLIDKTLVVGTPGRAYEKQTKRAKTAMPPKMWGEAPSEELNEELKQSKRTKSEDKSQSRWHILRHS